MLRRNIQPNDQRSSFEFSIFAICSKVHRDNEEVSDSTVSGKEVLQRLRTACL